MLGTLAILFTYLPAALQTFTPNIVKKSEEEEESLKPVPDEPAPETWLSNAWAGVGRTITRHHTLVTAACLLLLVGGAIGLRKIQTSVQLLKLFDPKSRIISDYAWLESNFGKLVPMELIMRVPPAMQAEVESGDTKPKNNTDLVATAQALRMLERVEAVSRISTVVRRTLGETGLGVVGQATSADTFLPPLPYPTNGYTPIRTRFNRELLDGREDLLGSDYVRIEQQGPFQGSELWRISLRVGALSDVDYGQFITTLRTAVEPVMRAYDTREDLIKQLATNSSGTVTKLSGKDRVLVIGCEKPKSLNSVEMVDLDSYDIDGSSESHVSRINTREIYLASLGDLLSGEPIRRPVWVDPNSDESPLEVGTAKWRRLIGAVDAVIWVGGDGITQADFAGAQRLIDARSIEQKAVSPALLADGIPTVDGGGNLQVVYTGVIPVVYKAQRTLLASLVRSIGLAFVMIAVVMILLLNPGRHPFSWLRPGNFSNGYAAGMVSMIPNVFPVLFIFGVMGHLGRLVDIGTMMTASVAMGVAVDDTIHFLSWFRSYLDKGLSRVEAVIETYRRVGPAMTQTTIVGGLGLFVFALSTFTPTQRFGTLMLVLLAAALFGDLVLLPALLAGPAGRWFKPREGSEGARKLAADISLDEVESDQSESGQAAAAVAQEQGDQLPIDKESLPQLRVHFPTHRTDSPHRLKRR